MKAKYIRKAEDIDKSCCVEKQKRLRRGFVPLPPPPSPPPSPSEFIAPSVGVPVKESESGSV